MPVNAASRSIHLDDDVAGKHDVQFLVYSRLIGTDLAPLERHLKEHLDHFQTVRQDGKLGFIGPFFTGDGRNTGDGFYVLKVDSADEARRLADEDPLHRHRVRSYVVRPWLQALA